MTDNREVLQMLGYRAREGLDGMYYKGGCKIGTTDGNLNGLYMGGSYLADYNLQYLNMAQLATDVYGQAVIDVIKDNGDYKIYQKSTPFPLLSKTKEKLSTANLHGHL